MNKTIKTEVEECIKKVTLNDGTIVGLTGRSHEDYTAMEEKVVIICSEILGLDVIDVSQNLIVLGADSLSILEIVQGISDQFHIEIEPDELSSNVTIMKIAELIEKKTTDD